MLKEFNKGGKYLINAYQAVISSNQRLEGGLASLRKQVQETGDKIVRN